MKRVFLFFIALCLIAVSCSKQVHVPISYSVETERGEAPQDVYLPTAGHKYVELYVKFLTGSPTDSVTLEIKGLPVGISVTPQKATGVPTYYYKYVYTTDSVRVGTYPVSIEATAAGTPTKTYNYNLVVIPDDCAALFFGNLNGSNACSARNYTYAATAESVGDKNIVAISNFGGYGTVTKTYLALDCQQDLISIPSQDIGNGIRIEGNGTFTADKMTITYTATGTTNETCTVTFTK